MAIKVLCPSYVPTGEQAECQSGQQCPIKDSCHKGVINAKVYIKDIMEAIDLIRPNCGECTAEGSACDSCCWRYRMNGIDLFEK